MWNLTKLYKREFFINANLIHLLQLSHLGLGWLYVYSSFPLRLPCPLPQQLLPLTSKPFELSLRYLGQRIYRSGEMYWMTFWWPWPRVMAVALICTYLLVCTIKWETLIQSLQNVVALLYFGKFSQILSDLFFQGQILLWPYLWKGWHDWCETKRKSIGWILGMICDIELWPHS